MAGRGQGAAIAAALHAVAQAVGQHPNAGAGGNDGVRMLDMFLKNHPPTFKGRYDLDGAQTWLKEVERIFRVMPCSDAQMVRFGTHMLAEEADDLWSWRNFTRIIHLRLLSFRSVSSLRMVCVLRLSGPLVTRRSAGSLSW